MDWNGVAAESIERQKIEILGRFAFHRETGVAERGLHFSVASRYVRETGGCQPPHLRIDLINSIVIAWPSVGRNRAGAQSDQPNPSRSVAQSVDGHSDTTVCAIISGRPFGLFRVCELKAVGDAAMLQQIVMVFRIVPI